MAAVFITNQMLTAWTDQGKVRLDDTTLHLLHEDRTVKLKPAVRFTKLIDEGQDPNKLIGKVKSRDQLTELGAEHYMDSVILGDVGYTVVEGFLGDLSPPPRPAPAEKTPMAMDVPPTQTTAPAPVSMPPPEPVTTPPTVADDGTVDAERDAEELSRLFLTTVRD